MTPLTDPVLTAADSGGGLGASRATVTWAIAAAKPAHLLQPAALFCGTVLIADDLAQHIRFA